MLNGSPLIMFKSITMKRSVKFLFAIISGLLMAFSWPMKGIPILILFAFLPLLFIEDDHRKNKSTNNPYGIFWYTFLAFLIFNGFTTYWIYNAALAAGIFAVIFTSLLMTLTFQLFHITARNFDSNGASYTSFIALWLSYEFIQLRWDLNWPWMNLGGAFGIWPSWVQWYEITGVFGGTLWILLVNILIFMAVKKFLDSSNKKIPAKDIIVALGLIAVPVIYSQIRYATYEEKSNPVNVVVVQPNIDPYNEQYDLDPMVVTRKMIDMALTKCDSATDFIVCPESAIQEYIFEDQFNTSPSINTFRDLKKTFPEIRTVVGLSSRKIFADGEPLTATARKFRDADKYYDAYNTAMLIDNDSSLQAHHKSKLTPGVERMPYPKFFRFLEKFAMDLGGTIGSLGIDEEQIPFKIASGISIAPIICYESAFGEFTSRFVANGANVIFVITNDGWWKDTPGHRQHMVFSAVRAIETRRSVARSANTGFSCLVNQRGDISQRTDYWVPAVIKGTINANDKITFFVKYGDFIGRAGVLTAILFLLLTIVNILRKRTISVQVKSK